MRRGGGSCCSGALLVARACSAHSSWRMDVRLPDGSPDVGAAGAGDARDPHRRLCDREAVRSSGRPQRGRVGDPHRRPVGHLRLRATAVGTGGRRAGPLRFTRLRLECGRTSSGGTNTREAGRSDVRRTSDDRSRDTPGVRDAVSGGAARQRRGCTDSVTVAGDRGGGCAAARCVGPARGDRHAGGMRWHGRCHSGRRGPVGDSRSGCDGDRRGGVAGCGVHCARSRPLGSVANAGHPGESARSPARRGCCLHVGGSRSA